MWGTDSPRNQSWCTLVLVSIWRTGIFFYVDCSAISSQNLQVPSHWYRYTFTSSKSFRFFGVLRCQLGENCSWKVGSHCSLKRRSRRRKNWSKRRGKKQWSPKVCALINAAMQNSHITVSQEKLGPFPLNSNVCTMHEMGRGFHELASLIRCERVCEI